MRLVSSGIATRWMEWAGADRVHVRSEELEEVRDGHVDRDGEHAELGRALVPERIIVLEDSHLWGSRSGRADS